MVYIKLIFKEWLAEYGVSGEIYIFVAIISFIIAGKIMKESNFYFGKLCGLLLWMLIATIISILLIILFAIFNFIKANLFIILIILSLLLISYLILIIIRKREQKL